MSLSDDGKLQGSQGFGFASQAIWKTPVHINDACNGKQNEQTPFFAKQLTFRHSQFHGHEIIQDKKVSACVVL